MKEENIGGGVVNLIIAIAFIFLSLPSFAQVNWTGTCSVLDFEPNAVNLAAQYRSNYQPLVVTDNEVISCTCLPGRSLAGDTEQRDLAGDVEQRSLAGDVEQRSLAGDVEQRSLAGDVEQRSLAGDVEQRSLAGDTEQRSLAGDMEQRSLAGDVEERSLGGRIADLTCGTTPSCNGVVVSINGRISLYDSYTFFPISGSCIN